MHHVQIYWVFNRFVGLISIGMEHGLQWGMLSFILSKEFRQFMKVAAKCRDVNNPHRIHESRSLHFSGDDLKVSHISFESDDIAGILKKLSDLGIEYKKSVSVPDPAKSRANKFEADLQTKPTSVIQYFLRDPDGYYIEICNCEVLTAFCFRQGEEADHGLHGYAEGITLTAMLGAIHWRHTAHDPATIAARLAAYDRDVAERADEAKLANLLARRLTYGDICQGFSEDELRDVLRRAGNDVRVAVAHLTALRGADRVLIPPPHMEGSDTPYQPHTIHLHTKTEVTK
jgi:hypothetical protein